MSSIWWNNLWQTEIVEVKEISWSHFFFLLHSFLLSYLSFISSSFISLLSSFSSFLILAIGNLLWHKAVKDSSRLIIVTPFNHIEHLWLNHYNHHQQHLLFISSPLSFYRPVSSSNLLNASLQSHGFQLNKYFKFISIQCRSIQSPFYSSPASLASTVTQQHPFSISYLCYNLPDYRWESHWSQWLTIRFQSRHHIESIDLNLQTTSAILSKIHKDFIYFRKVLIKF